MSDVIVDRWEVLDFRVGDTNFVYPEVNVVLKVFTNKGSFKHKYMMRPEKEDCLAFKTNADVKSYLIENGFDFEISSYLRSESNSIEFFDAEK